MSRRRKMPGLLDLAGTCRVCGCTDDRACPDGCAWANSDHTLCTRCVNPDAGKRRGAGVLLVLLFALLAFGYFEVPR